VKTFAYDAQPMTALAGKSLSGSIKELY